MPLDADAILEVGLQKNIDPAGKRLYSAHSKGDLLVTFKRRKEKKRISLHTLVEYRCRTFRLQSCIMEQSTW